MNKKWNVKKHILSGAIILVLTMLCCNFFQVDDYATGYSESNDRQENIQKHIEEETAHIETIMSMNEDELQKSDLLENVDSTNEGLGTLENLPEIYVDKEKNLYQIENGEVLGYISADSEDSNNSPRIALPNAIDIAKEYLLSITEKKDYRMSKSNYNEYLDTYRVFFNDYIGEYKTTDAIYIEMDAYGNILCFSKTKEGEFDSVELNPLSEKDLEKKAKELSIYNDIEGAMLNLIEVYIDKIDNMMYYRSELSYTNVNTGEADLETVYVPVS